MKLNKVLAKIDRWSTIALLSLFYIFMVSGYMITKGLINRYWGILLHNNLDLPIMVVFSIHFTTRLRFFMIRRKLADGLILNIITLLVGLLSFGIIIYFDTLFNLA